MTFIDVVVCGIIPVLGFTVVYLHHGGGTTGLVASGLCAVITATLVGSMLIVYNIKEKEIKKEFISLNENIIKNKKVLNENMRFIEEPPYLSNVNSKQKSVDLQSVNVYICNVIKKNLISNIDNKYNIKDIVINNNDKSLCKKGNANRIQYTLEIN